MELLFLWIKERRKDKENNLIFFWKYYFKRYLVMYIRYILKEFKKKIFVIFCVGGEGGNILGILGKRKFRRN